jgi:mannan endo-1,4-beta-mannosidase
MTAGSAGSSGMAGTGGSGPIRIMPLGDGITAGTCMRAFLWAQLRDGVYPAFDFVGSRTSTDTCVPTEYDKNSEGHAGYRVSDLLSPTSLHTDTGGDPYTGSSADLAAWFDGRPADIVLMLFGSNDFLNTMSSAADVQNAYSAILARLRSVNPHVTLLVGLLPPMSSAKCNASCASRLSDLNAAMPGWVASVSTADSRVVVVDLFTGFDTTNTTDGVKPDDTGAQFLAGRWYSAIRAL